MTRTRQRLLVVVLALAAFLVPAAAAYAVWSTTATVAMTVNTVPVVAPANPTALNCTGLNDPRTLSWTAGARATEYRVYRTDINPDRLIGTVTGTSLQISEALMGNPAIPSDVYPLSVRSWNEAGESTGAALSVTFKTNRDC